MKAVYWAGLSLNENKERARKEERGGVGNISLIATMTTLFVWLLAMDIKY